MSAYAADLDTDVEGEPGAVSGEDGLRHPNGGGIEAVVRDVRPLGDVVRIELELPDGTGASRFKLSRERYRESRLAKGERVYLRRRNPQVFLEARGPTALAQ